MPVNDNPIRREIRSGTAEFQRLRAERPELFERGADREIEQRPGGEPVKPEVKEKPKENKAEKEQKDKIQKFASDNGISEKAARETISRYKNNPAAEEFKTLGVKEIRSLNSLTGNDKNTNLIEVNRQRGGGEYVTQAAYDQIDKTAPLLADTLKRYGLSEYEKSRERTSKVVASQREFKVNQATKKLQKAGALDKDKKLDVAKALAANIPLSVMLQAGYSVSRPDIDNARKQLESQKLADKYKGWTGKELQKGKVVNGVFIPPPVEFGVQGGVYTPPPIEIQKKINKTEIEAFNTPSVLEQLRKMVEGNELPDYDKKILAMQTATYLQQNEGFTKQAASLTANMALDMLPIIGTYREIKRDIADGKLTAKEVAWIATYLGIDAITLTGALSAVGVGARAAVGVGRGARAAGALKALGQYGIAEIKAPIAAIRHPVRTAKDILQVAETVVKPSKIPLAAVETKYSTLRFPVKAFASEAEAMNVRDIGVLAAIREGKYTSKVGNLEITLSPSRLQELGGPVAIHVGPDMRPFMQGATIQAGREGGLFVAPNFHSRFFNASAFGDIPEGGIKGALIIRDEAILSKLGGSGKLFKNQVEVEALLKAGVELPPPSQVLKTRIGGESASLLVIGKPYTAKEVANLKFFGALDNIKDAFTPAGEIKGAKALIGEYDDLIEVRKLLDSKTEKLSKLRKAGKTEEVKALEREIVELTTRSERLVSNLERPSPSLGRLFMAIGGNVRTNIPIGRAETTITRKQLNSLRDAFNSPEVRRALDKIMIKGQLRTPRLSANAREGIRTPQSAKEARETARAERKAANRGGTTARVKGGGSRVAPPPTSRTSTSRTSTPPPEAGVPPRTPTHEPPPPTPPTKTEPPEPEKGKRELSIKDGILKGEAPKGSITWKQGIVWWLINPPYGKTDIHALREKPTGAKVVNSKPTGTIQALRGKVNKDLDIDMGITDINIRKPRNVGTKGTIQFKADPMQKTTGDITIGDIKSRSLRGYYMQKVQSGRMQSRTLPRGRHGATDSPFVKSRRVGAYYATKVRGGVVLSRSKPRGKMMK